jgi:hypothetical protein
MIRAGVPQSVAMRISGHKTAAIFLRYDITSEEDKRAALEKVQAHRQALPVSAAKVAAGQFTRESQQEPAQFPHEVHNDSPR